MTENSSSVEKEKEEEEVKEETKSKEEESEENNEKQEKPQESEGKPQESEEDEDEEGEEQEEGEDNMPENKTPTGDDTKQEEQQGEEQQLQEEPLKQEQEPEDNKQEGEEEQQQEPQQQQQDDDEEEDIQNIEDQQQTQEDEDDDEDEQLQDLPPVSGSSGSVRTNGSVSPIAPQDRFKVTLMQPLVKKYTCPQCNDVLRYPVQFEECGHHVCSSCFHEFLRVEPRCPVDQAPINKDKCFLDKELSEEIMKLEVKCNNNEWGCKWEGIHKEAQPHSEKCEYTDILCINDCGAKFQRRFLQKHLDKDCPKKIISCAFCDERFLREEKKPHLEDCLKVPLPCPNKCDKKLTIARDELDQHIEVECPRTKIVCQFEEIGCPHRCSREKLSKHYKAGIIEHVRLVYDLLMKQGQRLDQHHELLQDHGALLETHQTQITDMERISRNQLIWRIDEFSRKMKEAKSGNTTTLFSPPFNTSKHGYRLCASLCLNGDGKGKGTHISAFISILKGAFDSLLKWPFSYRVSFYLLDQNTDPSLRKHIKFSIKPNPCEENMPFLGQPKMEKNASFGGAKFAKQEEAESRTYIKDDTIFLKIAVDCDGSVEP